MLLFAASYRFKAQNLLKIQIKKQLFFHHTEEKEKKEEKKDMQVKSNGAAAVKVF
jgi:hypothetical protein